MIPRRLNGPLAWSAASLLVVAAIATASLAPLARAVFAPSIAGEGVDDAFARLMDEHAQASELYRDRFEGRSVFFKPPRRPPPRQIVVREPKSEEPARPAPPPPPPAEPKRPPYSGPNIGGIIGDRVYFDGELRVSVGEERNGLKVISVDPPWGATVMYRDWEYTLPLFEHDDFFNDENAEREAPLSGFIEADDKSAASTASAAGGSTTSTDDAEADGVDAPAKESETAVVPAGSTRTPLRPRPRPKTSGDE